MKTLKIIQASKKLVIRLAGLAQFIYHDNGGNEFLAYDFPADLKPAILAGFTELGLTHSQGDHKLTYAGLSGHTCEIIGEDVAIYEVTQASYEVRTNN